MMYWAVKQEDMFEYLSNILNILKQCSWAMRWPFLSIP